MRKKIEKKKQMAEEEELGKMSLLSSEGAESVDGCRVSNCKGEETAGEGLSEEDAWGEWEVQEDAADGERTRKTQWYQGLGRVHADAGQAGEG